MRGHIRRRGKREDSWAIVVDLGPDPATGRRRQKWHAFRGNKKAAEAELRRILGELDKGTYVEPVKVTLGAFLDQWLAARRPDLAYRTWQGYSTNVNRHIKPSLGQVRLSALKPIQIQQLYGSLRFSGLSARTVLYVHRTLHVALENAVEMQLIGRNPADLVEQPRPGRPEITVLDASSAAHILSALDDHRLRVAAVLAVGAGLRRGEIVGLRWSDIDLERGLARILQTVQRRAGEGLQWAPTKSHRSRRAVALPRLVVAALRQWMSMQLQEKALMGDQYVDEGLVLAGFNGKPLDPDWVSKSFARAVKCAGFRGVRFHDLRHSHASLLMAGGVHPKVVQERLGHSQISITMDTYSHVLPGLQEEAAAAIDRALALPGKPSGSEG